MASVINTNISSLNAQHNLTKSGATLQTALERLSSGLRINSAKDDAAGLAISERMTAQINGLNQATRNANDGISLTQTAESAIAGMTDNLQRLRELAVQAANSTNSASDRASIQSEVAQLVSEIGRISGTTEFNGIKLLDGSFNGKTFQVGANANQTIAVAIESTSTNKLGSSLTSSLTAVNNGTAMAAGDLVLNGITIGSSVATSDNASTAGGAISAISKAAAINALTVQTGVTAKVDTTTAVGVSQTIAGGQGFVIINGVSTDLVTQSATAGQAGANRAALVSAINAKSSLTGVTATDTGLSATGIQLSAADGRNIVTSLSTGSGSVGGTTIFTSVSTGIKETTSYGNFTLSSSKAIAVTGSSSIANAGVVAGTYSTQTAAASTSAGSSTAFVSGDFKINGAVIGASLAASDTASTAGQANSAIAKAAAINAISGFSGVTATVNVNQLNGFTQTATADTGTITINGVATATITTSTDATANRTAVISAINAISGRTGVTAVDGGTAALGVHLIAADGRNIVSTHATFTASSNTGVSGSAAAYGTFTLSSDKKFTVSGGDTGASMSTIAMLAVGTYGSGQTGQSLNSLNVTTVDGANNAVSAIDNAINTLNSVRGDLGALQNRFTSTVSNLSSSSDNLNAARSRIRDADFAVETAKLSRGQILQQAGVAMLAQANALPNNVLALLK
jgi:flagellin